MEEDDESNGDSYNSKVNKVKEKILSSTVH